VSQRQVFAGAAEVLSWIGGHEPAR
jgi:hypothetical protein